MNVTRVIHFGLISFVIPFHQIAFGGYYVVVKSRGLENYAKSLHVYNDKMGLSFKGNNQGLLITDGQNSNEM